MNPGGSFVLSPIFPKDSYSIIFDFFLNENINDELIRTMTILEVRDDHTNIFCPKNCLLLEVSLY